jgi:AcrR family transcriptional regulator
MPTKPYHHGDLPAALLAAAETILRRDGLAAIGMRAIAREAGVSHTAAKPHFGDIAGLLGELAAVGYHRLADVLDGSSTPKQSPRTRAVARARAYVMFARDNPALFGLMFRNELIDMRRPSLQAAAGRAMRALALGQADAAPDVPGGAIRVTREQAMRMTAAWSYVHGLATLLIDNRLRGIVKITQAFDDPLELADAVLDHTAIAPA